MTYMKRRKAVPALVLAFLLPGSSHAIDNPDAPDYVGQFRSQAQQYEAVINEQLDGKSAADARGNYARFLDEQLNDAYRELLTKLSSAQQEQLRKSQRAWLRYRDTESAFVDANWTPAQFGSSSTLSRHDYRTSIVRDRIEQLLNYLQNY